MRLTDLLLALGHQYEVHWKFATRSTDGVQRGQHSGLRTLLIHRTSADEHFAKARLVHQRRIPRRRGPFRRINLLDVVHEIKTDTSGRAGIEGGKNTGLSIGRHALDLLKASLAQRLHGQFAAFGHATIFGCDGWLTNPLLKPLY